MQATVAKRYKMINGKWIQHVYQLPTYKYKWFGFKKIVHKEGKWIPLYLTNL